jgi:hypothetical protein
MKRGIEPQRKAAGASRGHVMDHVALSVADLNARSVMIEGPSREAIELVEIK